MMKTIATVSFLTYSCVCRLMGWAVHLWLVCTRWAVLVGGLVVWPRSCGLVDWPCGYSQAIHSFRALALCRGFVVEFHAWIQLQCWRK
jgi:hypothetical protein